MNLRELIFTDGVVLSLKSSPKGLIMHFRHYTDDLVEITFSGIREFEVNDCFSPDIADSTLKNIDGRYRLILKDDEGGGVFAIDFTDGEYKVI